jgi:hypothetical protein
MELNKRNIMIATSLLIIAGGIASMAVTRSIRRREVDEIYRVLNSGAGFYGSIDDMAGTAFNPDYISRLPKTLNIIKLSDSEVTKRRQELAKHLNVLYYNQNDHERVMSIFRGLSDQVQISQLARSFQTHEGKTLLSTLKSQMNNQRIKELYFEIRNYQPYRIAK